jgi:hypothetical protein
MAWWPLGRNRQKPAAGPPYVKPPVIGSVQHDGAWRDLPALQCTLADSLRPVAINDSFRESLASYADPSFVAPLAHHVEPDAGGLVDGLVSPGMPYAHASGPKMAVPHRVDLPASSRPGSSTSLRLVSAPPVQRSATSDSAADLPTVALQLPGMAAPDLEPAPSKDQDLIAPAEVVSQPGTGSVTELASQSDDHSLQSALLPVSVAVQKRGGDETELPVVPVVSRRTDASTDSLTRGKQREIEARSDAPTLGVSLERGPLTLLRTPITDHVSVPTEPAVQRIENVAQQVAPTQRSGAATHAPSSAPPAASATAPAISATPAVPFPTAQRLPSEDGKQVLDSLHGYPLAVSRQETQVPDRTNEAQMRKESQVQRLESFGEPAATPAVPPLERNLHPQTHVESATPPFGGIAEDPAVAALVAAAPSTFRGAQQRRADPEVPMGPAIIPEPWTPEPSIPESSNSVAPTAASGPGAAPSHSPLPTVSRLAPEAPIQLTTRPSASPPTLVVGQPILQARADAPSNDSRPSGAMSFSSMFGSEAGGETGSPAEDGFTSVQLQAADDSATPASEPTDGPTPPIATAAAPPAGPAGKPDDLDELARRLYEPITARLRAELWLDRERAGVMSNG